MQFTIPKGDIQRTEELVSLIKKFAAKQNLLTSNDDGDVYELFFDSEEDENNFKIQSVEFLKMR